MDHKFQYVIGKRSAWHKPHEIDFIHMGTIFLAHIAIEISIEPQLLQPVLKGSEASQ